ncbi:hypothetical protein P8452_71542 [Trifolium repens]|nr:hypothetical protein P8452_71542 [Trifolium repens]
MATAPLFTTTLPPPSATAVPPSTHSSQVATLAFLIDKSKSKNHLLQIHATLIRRGLHDHTILNFKLQRRYSAVGHLHYSVTLFNQTRNPDVFTWTSIIHAHTQSNLNDQALSYYAQMLTNCVQPNAFTFSSLLNGTTLQTTKSIHCHVVKFCLGSDTYVATGLVDGYARGGDFVSAEKLFDEMPEKSLVSFTTMLTCYAKHGKLREAQMLFNEMERSKDLVVWNVMIDGYAQNGFPNECLLLFRRMLVEKVKPDVITLLAVLSSCGQLGTLESGRWVHSYVKNEKIGVGVGVEVRVGTALVDMYCKCGSLEDARKVFDKIDGKDVVAWNSMIMGYALNGFSEEALKLFYEMCSVGVKPSYVTFIALLTACGHSGLVDKGWEIFNMMKSEYEMEPKVEHFGCMVSLLGRAGRLQEAYDLVKELHNNISLGEEIAEFLLSNDLASSGTYVLLSNIYAASGNWVGAAKVRASMKDSGIEKEPGCSTIEINNRVHEFIAGDLKHAKSKDIYLMLEEMNSWLKGNGYTPKTDIVLHDIGEEQKELSLEVHSEKLALAFGLISTRPGTTIKIVKNLRVCLDCHAAMKMISRITGRRIIMRDRNRFHHFDNGSCSCGDYW